MVKLRNAQRGYGGYRGGIHALLSHRSEHSVSSLIYSSRSTVHSRNEVDEQIRLALLGFVFIQGAGIVDNAVGRNVQDSRFQRGNKAVIVRNKDQGVREER